MIVLFLIATGHHANHGVNKGEKELVSCATSIMSSILSTFYKLVFSFGKFFFDFDWVLASKRLEVSFMTWMYGIWELGHI